MIQKKKFSDAIAANISVVGELLDAEFIYDRSVKSYTGNIDDIATTSIKRIDLATTGTFPTDTFKPQGSILLTYKWDSNARYQLILAFQAKNVIYIREMTLSTNGWGSWYKFTGLAV